MSTLTYKWQANGSEHTLDLVEVPGITPDAHDGCIGFRIVLGARK